MFRGLKKSIALCFIGFGIGTILVLLLPVKWWLMIIGVTLMGIGFVWLSY